MCSRWDHVVDRAQRSLECLRCRGRPGCPSQTSGCRGPAAGGTTGPQRRRQKVRRRRRWWKAGTAHRQRPPEHLLRGQRQATPNWTLELWLTAPPFGHASSLASRLYWKWTSQRSGKDSWLLLTKSTFNINSEFVGKVHISCGWAELTALNVRLADVELVNL